MNSQSKTDSGNKFYISIVVATIFLCLALGASLLLVLGGDLRAVPPTQLIDIGVEIFGMAICLILLYSCAMDRKLDKKNTILACLIVIIGFALFYNLADGFLEGNPSWSLLTKIIYTVEYLNDDLIVFVFWYFIYVELEERNQRYRRLNITIISVVSVSFVFTLLNCAFGFFFYLDENGNIIENSYAIFSLLPAVFVYFVILVCIIRIRATWREKAVLLSFEILPTVATMFLICGLKYSLVYPAYLLSVVLIYIEFYERRRKKIAQQQSELTRQSMALLVSQIQPHFIYNTLTTISNLCVKNPEQAEETTVLFSQYLRGNLDSLSQSEPIAFAKEMEHVKTYIALEKMRFKDKINVEYRLRAVDFKVPALSLQPIVENSIKHGICQKNVPGNLLISSEKTPSGHLVIIEDDGVGFNPEAKLPEDGKSHVGLTNVISRLENMSGATVKVESAPGNGCRVEILFP